MAKLAAGPAWHNEIAIMQALLLGRKAEDFPNCSVLPPPGPTAPDKTVRHACLCFSFWELTALLLPSPSPPCLQFFLDECQSILKKQKK